MQFRVVRAYNFFACQNIDTAAVADFSFIHPSGFKYRPLYRDIFAISDINTYLGGTIFKAYIRSIVSVIPHVKKITLDDKIL